MIRYFGLISALFLLLLFAAGCIAPQAKKSVIILFDSTKNATIMRTPQEVVAEAPYNAIIGASLLRVEASYQCVGHDTLCLPLGLQIHWTLTSFRERKRFGEMLLRTDFQRFRAGDNIAVAGRQWNMSFLIDSVSSDEVRHIAFPGNYDGDGVEYITHLFSASMPDRLLTVAEAKTFDITIAGKLTFHKYGEPLKSIVEFCRRAQSMMRQ